MSTKSQLITSVNGHLTEVIDIADHRASMLDLINQLYPTEVFDSNTTETYTTKSGTSIEYTIAFLKQGNCVTIRLKVRNITSGSIASGTQIFTFKTNEFKPKGGLSSLPLKMVVSNDSCSIELDANGIKLASSIAQSTDFYFQFPNYLATD
jgi:hypothetical protein